MTSLSLSELALKIKKLLKEAGIENPEIETKIILKKTLKLSDKDIALMEKEVSKEDEEKVLRIAKRRAKREPLQYIFEETNFFDFTLKVKKGIFIPRPETETLCEITINLLKDKKNLLILEIGTGTGAIAITLAKYLNAKIIATDICNLKIAKENIKKYNLEEKITLIKMDMLNALKKEEIFDAVISNPPYIKSEDIEKLQPEIKNWENKKALNGGKNGLKYEIEIINKAKNYLKKDGLLLLEADPRIINEMREIAKNLYKDVKIYKDLRGDERFLVCRN